jgi:P-type Ca2+ transporter type 2C
MQPPSIQRSSAQIFDISTVTGLSEKEAAARLAKEGHNELPSTGRRGILKIALEIVREPMFTLLIAGGIIYLLLGDVREALILLGSICVIMGITFYQENRTERALEALRDLSSPRALVIRDGVQKRIAGREVARGDILMLAEGDRVPADGVLLWSLNLSVDESLLTGESVPVRKVAWDGRAEAMAMARPGGDDLPFMYSGTLVVQGQGIAEVRATGLNTELGKIGKALQTVVPEETMLHKETGRLVRLLAILGLAFCALVVILYGLTRGNWLDGLLAGITLAMSLLPEEFPVVLTIFLALGAWRIAQNEVLTRRMPAVETLGSATVLCVDKTGTLTLNRMTVSRLFAAGAVYSVPAHDGSWRQNTGTILPETFHELVEFSILASQQDPFDPTEKAMQQLGEHYLAQTEHIHRDWTLVAEYPLSPGLLALSHVWKSPDSETYVIAAKGAPEAIMDLCHLDEAQKEELSRQVINMADDGLRVLGVAKAYFKQSHPLPSEQHDFTFEFTGLVGLADPVRPMVANAVKECYTAGIRVVMITGDYPGTARNIARQIGLKPVDEYITGAELDAMDDAELQERIKTVNIFARVVPEQKLRLVNALKANGEIVAMTGDGVNDAPALKSSHIGIAMGERGTDVAREAASLVLLDDDFSSIVQAVKLGRRIYDNIRKAMIYILAIHVPIAGIALVPLLLGWPLILFPVHIVFLELIIDPASSIVFEVEPGNPRIMERPPRNPKEPMFGTRTLIVSLLQGASVLLSVLAIYLIAFYQGLDESVARAMTFTTLIIGNLGLIYINRSQSRLIMTTLRERNVALWLITAAVVVGLGLVLYVPFVSDVFSFASLNPLELLLCVAAALLSVLWFEIFKLVQKWRKI